MKRQPTILASPLIVNGSEVRVALSALGLELNPSSASAGQPYEHGLLLTDDLKLDYNDMLASIQRIIKASHGLLVTADVLALRDIELTARDALAHLNKSMGPSRGQFFYIEPDDLRTVLLSPEQLQALTARGWRFQISSDTA